MRIEHIAVWATDLERLKNDGFKVLREPRETGDGI